MINWIIDARDANHPVSDQGRRPTCLAMSMTAAHEHAVGGSLSAEYLHWASGKHSGGRGAPIAATAALREDGQPASLQWPYSDCTDEKVATYKPPASVIGPFAKRNIAAKQQTFDEIVNMLCAGRWPILGLRVTRAFAAAGTGIVVPGGPGRGGHAVLVVGAAEVRGTGLEPDVMDGERLLCVRNSWGPGWGNEGHKLITESAVFENFITAFALQ